MSDAADDLLRAVARLMADGQRVLLVGASFETIELLADAPLRELVIVSDDADPDAPAGETARGAPLRLRPDWKERARSKDLIVDPAGAAPVEEVERILKKEGVYLSAVPSPVLDALPFSGAVEAGETGALVLAPTEGPSELIEALLFAGERRPGPLLYVAGREAVALPAVAVLRGAGPDPAASAATTARADEAERALADAQTAIAETHARLDAAIAEAAAAKHRAEAAEAQLADRAALEAALAVAHRERDEGRAALTARDAELAELEADYEKVRTELAERRFDDRRFESLRARFESARAEMADEVARLRARLLEVDAPAEDFAALVASRDRARSDVQRLLARLADTLARLAPTRRLPATPVHADSEAAGASIDAWLEVVETVVDATATELAELRDEQAGYAEHLGELVARIREQHAAIEALTAEAAEAPAAPVPTASDDEAAARLAALEAALDSERALRAAERAERLRAIEAAQAAEREGAALKRRVVDERRAAAAARLAAAAAEDEAERLAVELRRRAAQAGDLEEMITAHDRMEALLTEALQVAEERAETAETARRLAESNLRLLRGEFERLRPGPG
ncbi:MAG: hypothetical protein R3F65_02230 [bacterium]